MKKSPLFSQLLAGMLLLICTSFTSTVVEPTPHQQPYEVKNYLRKYKYLSIELNQQTGIPIPIILAIAGLESNWGRSELAKQANNHFGIKVKPQEWWGPEYCKPSLEYQEEFRAIYSWECFRKYPLIRESYQDFGKFILRRPAYQWLLNSPAHNYVFWAQRLEDANYATDPYYAEKLVRVIEEYGLDEL